MVSTEAPAYWQHETSGVLKFSVLAYLAGGPMSLEQIGVVRAYLRQWIEKGHWKGGIVRELFRLVGQIHTRSDIEAWVDMATDAGFDPL